MPRPSSACMLALVLDGLGVADVGFIARTCKHMAALPNLIPLITRHACCSGTIRLHVRLVHDVSV